jgi:WD repeat and SOF domain-containing protein 1
LRFIEGEKFLREAIRAKAVEKSFQEDSDRPVDTAVTGREDMDDEVDLSWSTVLKRTFEAYVRGERPNMYGEWLEWESR